LYREAQLESKGVASAASVTQAEMQGRVHSLEVRLSQEQAAHELQLSQLQQQVEALEADKAAALMKCDEVTKTMQTTTSKADGAATQVARLQQEIEIIHQVS
jgi:chromosome segregation ATPase